MERVTEQDLLDYGIIIPKKWDLKYFRYLVNIGYKVAIEDVRHNIIYLLSSVTPYYVSTLHDGSVLNITNASSVSQYIKKIQLRSFTFISTDQAIDKLMEVSIDYPSLKYSKLKVLWRKLLNKIF